MLLCEKYERLLQRNLEVLGIIIIVLMLIVAAVYYYTYGDIIFAVAVGVGGGYIIATVTSVAIALLCVAYDKIRGRNFRDFC